ncbi:MAG: rane protein [Lacunisphaera sp.]|nr:rane protein [Lacunisphaera sp.]MDB6165083.1 rane protein [Lacunisphaera sp.]
MNRAVFLVLLVVGVILLIYGINAHDSLASTAKQAVTGTPTDRSIWLIVLGVAGIIIGGLGAMFRRSGS